MDVAQDVVTGLENPSYLTYSHDTKLLFVCDADKILKFDIRIMQKGLSSSKPQVLARDF